MWYRVTLNPSPIYKFRVNRLDMRLQSNVTTEETAATTSDASINPRVQLVFPSVHKGVAAAPARPLPRGRLELSDLLVVRACVTDRFLNMGKLVRISVVIAALAALLGERTVSFR